MITLFVLLFLVATPLCAQRLQIENVTNQYANAAEPLTRSGMQRIAGGLASSLPTTGSPNVPVILVQFTDMKFTSFVTEECTTAEDSAAAVNAGYVPHFNGSGIPGKPYRIEGGSWGSVSDYFIEQSDSLFSPHFTIIGPVTLTRSYSYYGKNSGSSKDVNINAMYSEAMTLAQEQEGIDWTTFDNNGDGTVDFAFYIYAGPGENETSLKNPDLIWPKECTFPTTINGLTISGLGCANEISNGETDGIGGACHELSHALGIPDFYDYNHKAFGMGLFDVMDMGNYQMDSKQPCCYSAHQRELVGWRTIDTLPNDSAMNVTLYPIEAGGKAVKIVSKTNPNEYFILENRQNIGFDTYYGMSASNVYTYFGEAMHGLYIIHVDYSETAWRNNTINTLPTQKHMRYTIIPADGHVTPAYGEKLTTIVFDMRGDAYPGEQGVTELLNDSIYSGADEYSDRMLQAVTDIEEHEDGTVTFRFNGGTPGPDPQGVASTTSEASVIATEFFSINGIRLAEAPASGMYIRRTLFSDGSSTAEKMKNEE